MAHDGNSHGNTLCIDDIELYYELHGHGPPLLLLHGFSGSGRDFGHLFDLDALARKYQLITVDARGHGRSTNPSGSFTHRRSALDVRALLDHLGIERVASVGVSLGANTLLHLATAQPERVTAMVLVAAAIYYPNSARQLMRETAALEPSAEARRALREIHPRGDAQIDALFRQPAHFAVTFDDMNFTPPLLSTIRARCLLVNGDRDPLIPVELSLEAYRAVPRASLWVVPDAGHAPIFGEWREPFARAAIAFLGAQG